MRLMAGASPTRTHQLLEHSLRRRTPQSSKQGQSWGPGSDPLPMGLGRGQPLGKVWGHRYNLQCLLLCQDIELPSACSSDNASAMFSTSQLT